MAERIYRFSELDRAAKLTEERRLQGMKGHSTLERRAASLGGAVGKLVYITRRSRAALRQSPQQLVKDRVADLTDRSLARTAEWRAAYAQRARDWKRLAGERADELRVQAQERFLLIKDQADHLRREYPLHVAATAGALGFLIGVGLRIRRANRAQ